jgi:hypothetical protein
MNTFISARKLPVVALVREVVAVAATKNTTTQTGNLRKALVAACGLIGISGAAAEATEVGSAILMYNEPNRVKVVEAVVNVNHEFSGGKSANLKFVLDAMTGASASGATPASYTQTFTRPSGEGSYQIDAGETPLDDTFKDKRTALSAGGVIPLGRMTDFSGGFYVSGEHDYSSLGVNAAVTRDFDKRNTTLAMRMSYFHDTISPEGGRPVPFAEMQPVGPNQPRLGDDGSKDVMDLGLSLTRVLNRSTISQLSYTFSKVSGYITDPYKIVSQVDVLSGDPDAYLFESRPDERARHVLFGKVNHHLGRDIVSLSYRFLTDDWSIKSHTLDLTYRWNYTRDKYLRPHFRYYKQGAADFYRRYLVTGEDLPTNVSADYRLGDMTAYTVGLKHGRKLGNGHDLTLRMEYYFQTGESHPSDAIGNLKDYDLFPTVDAFIIQVGYSFGL